LNYHTCSDLYVLLAIRERNKRLMEDDVNGPQDDDSHPTKRHRTEGMALDDEETEIASGLEPIHMDQDETRSQDGDVDEQSGGDDFGGDGHGTGFEDNGVRLNQST
jgi:hypothetical protein